MGKVSQKLFHQYNTEWGTGSTTLTRSQIRRAMKWLKFLTKHYTMRAWRVPRHYGYRRR